jgi:hypothetical protein
MRAYWRKSTVTTCTDCKIEGVETEQTGTKRRGVMDWWDEFHLCKECRAKLPDTAPE